MYCSRTSVHAMAWLRLQWGLCKVTTRRERGKRSIEQHTKERCCRKAGVRCTSTSTSIQALFKHLGQGSSKACLLGAWTITIVRRFPQNICFNIDERHACGQSKAQQTPTLEISISLEGVKAANIQVMEMCVMCNLDLWINR